MDPSPAPPPLDPRSFVTPLRGIFWGGLLCVLDFHITHTSSGVGWRVDILNDFVGMLLITWGVFRLGSASTRDGYPGLMRFVKLASVLVCILAIDSHFIYDKPRVIFAVFIIIFLLALVATVVFCTAMGRLSFEFGLTLSQQSWRTTRILFVVLHLIPMGALSVASLVATLAGSSFDVNLGLVPTLLATAIIFVPIIHLFVSTSRMKRESTGGTTESGRDARKRVRIG